ncbi:hypothetical protein ABW21_db0207236 [Orbilia brochopaga]|nr:hypothetical protein ABW21_db0207236 [Drechslerella brochopaga]
MLTSSAFLSRSTESEAFIALLQTSSIVNYEHQKPIRMSTKSRSKPCQCSSSKGANRGCPNRSGRYQAQNLQQSSYSRTGIPSPDRAPASNQRKSASQKHPMMAALLTAALMRLQRTQPRPKSLNTFQKGTRTIR